MKKCDVRVTIIGEEVFATAIHPLSEETQIDFRADYGKLSHAPHTLPDEVCVKLLALTCSYHLAYAGIDLLLTPDDRYVYLELNALGQFGWNHRPDYQWPKLWQICCCIQRSTSYVEAGREK